MSRQLSDRIAWLQVLTAFAVLLPVAGAGLYVWAQHQHVGALLADLEPRYARLAGLLQHQADLKAMNVKANQQLAQMVYPVGQDPSQAGNDAQQRIRAIFVESQLNIISIQVLPPPKEDSKFDRIPINLRVEGDLAGIQNALLLLSRQNPVVLVDSLSLQTIGAVRPASTQRLGGQFNLFAIRLRP